jgi:hypothetical protein
MTPKNPRLAFWTLVALGVAILYAAFGLFATVVHAQAVDPVTTATVATSDLWDIIAKHKLLGVLAIVYGSVAKLLEANKTQGWITSGRWLAILTGGAASLAAFLDWKLGAGTLETFVLAAFGALMLIINPFVGTTPAPAPSAEVA